MIYWISITTCFWMVLFSIRIGLLEQLIQRIQQSGEGDNIHPLTVENHPPCLKYGESAAADNTCSICMDTMEPDQEIFCMPCTHAVHKECGESWFAIGSTCPVCRLQLNS